MINNNNGMQGYALTGRLFELETKIAWQHEKIKELEERLAALEFKENNK